MTNTRFSLVMIAAILALSSAGSAEFRSIDGTNNNPSTPLLGAADTPVARFGYNAFYPGDGLGTTMLEPPALENARVISNAVDAIYDDRLDPNGRLINRRGLSDFIWQWGQFLTHDMDLTPNNPANGVNPIAVPTGDEQFDPNGTGGVTIPFNRSDFIIDPNTGIREQVNKVTSFIDASNVYGSDPNRADALRAFSDGKLVMSAGNLPGFNTAGLLNDSMNPTLAPADLFLVGDLRGNEQVGLTTMHTLFAREHNRLAGLIAVQQAGTLPTDPTARDEEIYQRARRIVGAQMQIITYNHFLPALMEFWAPDPQAYAYSVSIDSAITQTFSHALFRFGHSMNSPSIQLVEPNGANSGEVTLVDGFFNPGFLANDPQNIDRILRGLASQYAEENDLRLVDELRNLLFSPHFGLDLLALDVQRGRDHGLPSYNESNVAYFSSGARRLNVTQITADPEIQQVLTDLYDIDLMASNIDNIDLFIGALAEDHFVGSLGLLSARVIRTQFERLRDGDRFFYLGTDAGLYDFIAGEYILKDEILEIIDLDTITLAQIIESNTAVRGLPEDVFFTGHVVPAPSAATWGLLGLALASRRRISRPRPA